MLKLDIRPMTLAERNFLANKRNLPAEIFDLLSVGFADRYDRDCFSFVYPERDAACAIVGYSFHYPDGVRRRHGKPGLYIPTTWAEISDPSRDGEPLNVCQGANDTLLALAMGLDSIGYPEDIDSVELLAELIRPISSERPIFFHSQGTLSAYRERGELPKIVQFQPR